MGKFDDIQRYLDFRFSFLEEEYQKNDKNLQCVYCGREHLDIGYQEIGMSHTNNKNSNLATIDHIVPYLKDDDRLNKSVCVVSCKRCNRKKGSILPSELKAPTFGNMRIDTFKSEYFTGNKMLSAVYNDPRTFTTRDMKTYKTEKIVGKLVNADYRLVDFIFDNNLNYGKKSNKSLYLSDNEDFTLDDPHYRISNEWHRYNIDCPLGKYSICRYENGVYSFIMTETNTNYKVNVIRNKSRVDFGVVCSSVANETLPILPNSKHIKKIKSQFLSLRVSGNIHKYVNKHYNEYSYSRNTKNFHFDNGYVRLSNNWVGTELSDLSDKHYHLARLVDGEWKLILNGQFNDTDKNHYVLEGKKNAPSAEKQAELRHYKKTVEQLIKDKKLFIEVESGTYLLKRYRESGLLYIKDGEIVSIKKSKNNRTPYRNLKYTLYLDGEVFPKNVEEYNQNKRRIFSEIS